MTPNFHALGEQASALPILKIGDRVNPPNVTPARPADPNFKKSLLFMILLLLLMLNCRFGTEDRNKQSFSGATGQSVQNPQAFGSRQS
jgi:hypothetical protein